MKKLYDTILLIFLFLFSRPIFFKIFYYLNKVTLYGMNRVSAAKYEPYYTGESIAIRWIFKKLNKSTLTVIDCGAGNGDYAKIIIDTANKENFELKLFLVEPSLSNLKILRNKYKCKILNYAISNYNGYSNLYYPWEGAGGSSLSKELSEVQLTHEYKLKNETVNVITLDALCEKLNVDYIDILKLDIEGYEFNALQGAMNLINNCKIRYIQFEVGSASLITNSTLFNIYNLLKDKYRFYLILNRGLVKIYYKTDLECFYGASNFLLEKK